MPRRDAARLEFEALSIEGALFPAEWLARVARLDAPRQGADEYGVPKGLGLREEIARYWRIAQAHWADFGSAPGTGTAEVFVEALLAHVLGFEIARPVAPPAKEDRLFPITFIGSRGRVPVIVAPPEIGLDAPLARFGGGGRRRSAFALAQDWLNASEDCLWGIATNGFLLRLLRDNPSLARPAFLEMDLGRIFSEERFADFSMLWLVLQSSRFGLPGAAVADCPLEAWLAEARAAGTRARAELRRGVEAALVELGQGFLRHPANDTLREALSTGTVSKENLFQELLRLVYRIIFLLTVEERGLLHPETSEPEARSRYAEGYSLRRLAMRAARRDPNDRYDDLWDGVRIVFRTLAVGELRLGLPGLGGLFAPEECAWLDAARLPNRALLNSLFRLAWLRTAAGLERVAWRDMGPEEFGSVYESLLELVPEISDEGRGFQFTEATSGQGNARKQTGSYYTHDDLVQLLLDLALEPLIASRVSAAGTSPTEALLQIRLVDPACGSGHFLLSAARRIAVHLARLRAEGSASPSEYRAALREVISHCIYGVDRNPMAVELCKAALWIETVVPGRPLSFLDGHLRCGDALLGILDLRLLDEGIPSEAYQPRDGDEKATATALRQANRQRVEGTGALPLIASAAVRAREVEALPEDTLEEVEAKRAALLAAEADAALASARLRGDLFCSAFFARKTTEARWSVPITADIDRIATGQPARPGAVATARRLARQHRFFHWPLMFADVFACGGFDLILGNPPWETMSPDAKEWFAPYDPEVRELAPAQQKQRIAELLSGPGMRAAWDAHCQALYDAAAFMRESGRFKLFAEGNLGKGDFNVYRMFVETALTAVRTTGVAAQFVPESFYSGTNAAAIRAAIFTSFRLKILVGFANTTRTWFPSVYYRMKFCLYVADKSGSTETFRAAFGVNTVTRLGAVRTGQTIPYPVAQVREFSPDALAIAEITHPSEIAIVQKLYARFPKFGVACSGLAQRRFMREMDMGNDREGFGNDPRGVPLYEGRMVEAFDHRAKAYISGRARKAVWRELAFKDTNKKISPQWRISDSDIPSKIGDRSREFRIGFCDVASTTNSRSLVAALIPAGAICGHKVPTITFQSSDPRLYMLWLGVANAFCIDYLARKKISLTMSFSVMDSLPLPRTYGDSAVERRIASRALRLTATGPEMLPFWIRAAQLLELDPQRDAPCEERVGRQQLRAELDVYVARDLFGLTRDEMRYLLDPADILGADCGFETFGVLQRAECKEFGEFRTRRIILETWDRMPQEAALPELTSVAER
jgi:hypothetical protein